MKIRTKSTGTDKKGVCWSTLNPLVIILRAHFYTGIPRMCVLRSEHPRHLNVWGVLRHCVPNKGMPPLRCLRHLSQRTLQRKQSADADCPRRKV